MPRKKTINEQILEQLKIEQAERQTSGESLSPRNLDKEAMFIKRLEKAVKEENLSLAVARDIKNDELKAGGYISKEEHARELLKAREEGKENAYSEEESSEDILKDILGEDYDK